MEANQATAEAPKFTKTFPLTIVASSEENCKKIAKFLNIIYTEVQESEMVFALEAIETNPEVKAQALVMLRNTEKMEKFMKSSLAQGMAWFFGLTEKKPKKKKTPSENSTPEGTPEPTDTPKPKRKKLLGIF